LERADCDPEAPILICYNENRSEGSNNTMPLYDYRCEKCGSTFEVRQKFSDELLQTHEGCGGKVERLISAAALQFKGTGWYVTDYARNGKSPSTSSPSSESKAESKSDTKTDGKKSESKSAPVSSSTDK
jgi:putative FmdB family regulatory protein